jgi:hypothetical protein
MGGVSLVNYVPEKFLRSTFYIAFRFSGESDWIFMDGRCTKHPDSALFVYPCTASKLSIRYVKVNSIVCFSTYRQDDFGITSMTLLNLFTIFWQKVAGHLVGDLRCKLVNVLRHVGGTFGCSHPPRSKNERLPVQGVRT